jgi:hypothetical protein
MAETWKVTAQRQTSMVVAGAFVPAMEVTFETTDGDTGSVLIPVTQYDADAVKLAIDARVAAIAQVRAL